MTQNNDSATKWHPSLLADIDISRPLKHQRKPDFVCEPGDPRVEKFGWVKQDFRGYLSIDGNTIWISSIESRHKGRGNLSRLIKNIHESGFRIKVPSPFPRMESICQHLGFVNYPEIFPEMGEMISVYILEAI